MQLAVYTLVRWFLLCLSVPTATSNARRARLLAPTTVYSRLTGILMPLAKTALQEPPRTDGLLLARLRQSDYETGEDTLRHRLEFRRLDYLARRGLWIDLPTSIMVKGEAERSNRGPAHQRKSAPKKTEWKPLPDALAHAVGWRAAWITECLAPALLDVFEQTIALRKGWAVQQNYEPGNRLISSCAWEIPGVDKNAGLPFEVVGMSWPPRNSMQLLVWLKLVQQSHAFITGLSAGPRASETLSWRTDCLVEGRDGITLAKGRTFKIVAPVDGATTVWPMPKIAVQAVCRQVRLSLLVTELAQKIEEEQSRPEAKVAVRWNPIASRLEERGLTRKSGAVFCGLGTNTFYDWSKGARAHIDNVVQVADALDLQLEELFAEPEVATYAKQVHSGRTTPVALGPQPLWRVFGGKGKGNALRGTYNDDFRGFVHTLGLVHLSDDQKLVYHRFRKTIARIVALCYAPAPQILMDIFGHKDIDMTLHYILADTAILADINAIQREIKVMKAAELIQNVDACGGAGAKRLKAAVSQFKMGIEHFGTDDAYEAAVMWTLDGRTWDYMGHGRYCLKGPLDRAPCAKGHSIANKAKCKKDCEHRLCAPEGMRDNDEAISSAVAFLEQAWASEDHMMATQWSGQILAKTDDYEQLYEKWKRRAVVARVLLEAGRDVAWRERGGT
jgi:hypothetical protein